MKHRSLPPSDDDLDRLLGSRLKRTSSEFELRWRELRAEWAHSTPAFSRGSRRLLWSALTTAGLALVAFVAVLRYSPASSAPRAGDEFADILSLDVALSPGRALLERETREAVLYLPLQSEL